MCVCVCVCVSEHVYLVRKRVCLTHLLPLQKQLRCKIESYQPFEGLVSESRALLVGHVGAGKSSFVNSCASALLQVVTMEAYARDKAGKSVTTDVRTRLICCYHASSSARGIKG